MTMENMMLSLCILAFGVLLSNAGETNCGDDEFMCDVDRCKKITWMCDGLSDCIDGSDERNCSNVPARKCAENQFLCDETDCKSIEWRCDGLADCLDGTDEDNCQNEKITATPDTLLVSTKYASQKSQTKNLKLKVSSVTTAPNNERTRNIDNTTTTNSSTTEAATTCKTNEFRCLSGSCIPLTWRCDAAEDCEEGEDEEDCRNVTTTPAPICSSDQFLCQEEQRCIPRSLMCNRSPDCKDLSDEIGCGKRPCIDGEVRCTLTQYCIFSSWVCDNENDCVDESDEANCKGCSEDEFACPDGLCRKLSSKCDTLIDCFDGSDERNCTKFKEPSPCTSNQFTCASDKSCIPFRKVCDRIADCSDRSDETDCGFATCRDGEFECRSSGTCLLNKWVCDGYRDCFDGSDEEDCSDVPDSSSIAREIAPNPPSVTPEEALEPSPVIPEEATEFQSECPEGFDSFRGRCLWVSAFPRQWLRARELCYEMKSTLARFPLDPTFNAALLDFLQDKSISGWNYWVGKPERVDDEDQKKKEIKIPAWFLGGRTVSTRGIGLQVYRQDCFYLDYFDFMLYKAKNCMSYGGVICQATL